MEGLTVMRELAVRQVPNPALLVPEGLARFLKLLAEPNRLRILTLLAAGEQCVCDIETALAMPQNLVSHHLAGLKRAGLIVGRREGTWVYYRIEPQTLGEYLGALNTMLDTRYASRRASPCALDGSQE